MATFARFLLVGLLNSAIGYSVILLGLAMGWGDYAANAAGYGVGLTASYLLNRRFTFVVKTPATPGEMIRFAGAGLGAYAVNLVILTSARSVGYAANPWAQACAMAGYSVTFFLISRFIVFSQNGRRSR